MSQFNASYGGYNSGNSRQRQNGNTGRISGSGDRHSQGTGSAGSGIAASLNEDNYVDKAEEVIKQLKFAKDDRGRDKVLVTTSKIRNILSMVSDIYNDAVLLQDDELTDDIKERINYMRLRFYYEAGRDDSVRAFINEADIIGLVKSIGNSRRKYILFSRYMEALVAFRKFYGGRDE